MYYWRSEAVLAGSSAAFKGFKRRMELFLQAEMAELPAQIRRRFRDLELPAADVLVLADDLPTAKFFDAVLERGAPPKAAANWVMGDIMAFSKVTAAQMSL